MLLHETTHVYVEDTIWLHDHVYIMQVEPPPTVPSKISCFVLIPPLTFLVSITAPLVCNVSEQDEQCLLCVTIKYLINIYNK